MKTRGQAPSFARAQNRGQLQVFAATDTRRQLAIGFATSLLLLAFARFAAATPSPPERCVADKTGAMSKYAACVLKARRGLILTGDTARYEAALAKCSATQTGIFGKAEANAGSGVCPVEDDALDIAAFTDSCLAVMGEGLNGGAMPTGLSECYDDLSACEASFSSCDTDLSACLASLGSQMLKTGQTICTNAGGSTVPCPGSGQDGEFLAGISPSYTDNGDGTITDNVTGLMWEKLSNDGSIHDKDTQLSWNDAIAKVASLNSSVFAGHSDWRLPNIRELETLVDYGNDFPSAFAGFNDACPVGCTVLSCSCTRSFNFWSSTTYENDRSCAWNVDFSVGSRNGILKTSLYHVRAVRGGL